jgi:hypothetical protein
MTRRFGWALYAFQLGLLRAASLLAPAGQRAEWRREWRAELWHVRRTHGPQNAIAQRDDREVTAFCLGAFQDALCLRRETWKKGAPAAPLHGSAAECILLLAAALALSFALARLLPGVRAQQDQLRFEVNPGLILIENERADDGETAAIPVDQYRMWRARSQRNFDEFAFYRMARENALAEGESGTPQRETHWNVAHASVNLFRMLGLPLRFSDQRGESDGNVPAAVLSCAVFESQFGGNAQIVGSVVRVGQQSARIAGVAPCDGWTLPGTVDAWLLESDAAIGARAKGYVVAHLSSRGQAEMTASRAPIVTDEDRDEWISGVSIEGHKRGPWDIYLFTVFLAFLALPAITSVSMGEYGFNSHKPSWPERLSRWGLLSGKIALLLPIVFYVPLDLAYWHVSPYSFAPQYIQLITTFSMCLFGMRWVLLDQRQRCPVCLRRVTHPAQVGHASRTFLSWNGTELMCAGGHTLLHVPGLPTSWFSRQRWLYLDTSWEFLFAGSSEP